MKKLIFVLLTALMACNQTDCGDQQNPIMAKNRPESEPYQEELRRLIAQAPGQVRYSFEDRINDASGPCLMVESMGTDFCGLLKITLEQEDEQSRKLQSRAGYRGARLMGLRLDIRPNAAVYRGLGGIHD